MRNIDFSIIPIKDNSSALGHPILEFVFLNIITNAVRYRKEGVTCVNLEIVAELKKDELILFFKDYRIGIPDSLKSIVFNRFTVISTERRGSGLGFSIARRILESIGGKIWIENLPELAEDPTIGSVFYIRLKRVD